MIEELYPPEKPTTNYNELVDYQVSNMKSNQSEQTNIERPPFIPKTVSINDDNIYSVPDNNPRKSFDELYEEFSSKSIDDQVNNLKELGRKLVSQIDGIVDKLNVIIEDIEEEESNNKEYEITVDPETHKVLYNAELNEYKVVRRED